MINITPINDLKEHIDDSTCKCNPKVEFENGEMIVIHNSYDNRELRELITKEQLTFLDCVSFDMGNTIFENTQLFVSGYNKGDLKIEDLKEMLIQSEKEEEFELSICLVNAINLIQLNEK